MDPELKRELGYVGAIFVVLLALVGLMAGMSALGIDDQTRTDVQTGETDALTPAQPESVPETVTDSQQLARAVYTSLGSHIESESVYIRESGEIVVEYSTTAESSGELRTEFNRLAVAYGDVVAETDNEPQTLYLVSGRAMAVVPEPAVRRYAEGNLTKRALTKTVEITDVKRTN